MSVYNACKKFSQAMVPLLKKAASHISGDEMSIGRAAVVNISSELASLTYSTTGSKNYGFSYKCSKVQKIVKRFLPGSFLCNFR